MLVEGRAALWLVAGPLIALKVWATVVLFIYEPTRAVVLGVIATTWPWVVAVLILVAAPSMAWYRLVKVRARRTRLKRSEWMVGETTPMDRSQWPEWVTAVRANSEG